MRLAHGGDFGREFVASAASNGRAGDPKGPPAQRLFILTVASERRLLGVQYLPVVRLRRER